MEWLDWAPWTGPSGKVHSYELRWSQLRGSISKLFYVSAKYPRLKQLNKVNPKNPNKKVSAPDILSAEASKASLSKACGKIPGIKRWTQRNSHLKGRFGTSKSCVQKVMFSHQLLFWLHIYHIYIYSIHIIYCIYIHIYIILYIYNTQYIYIYISTPAPPSPIARAASPTFSARALHCAASLDSEPWLSAKSSAARCQAASRACGDRGDRGEYNPYPMGKPWEMGKP